MTPAEARALMRKRQTIRSVISHTAHQAKADARARRLLDMVDSGMTYPEIAAALGIRVKSVRGAVHDAKKRLASIV